MDEMSFDMYKVTPAPLGIDVRIACRGSGHMP
jgi:hypothetical protein